MHGRVIVEAARHGLISAQARRHPRVRAVSYEALMEAREGAYGNNLELVTRGVALR